MRSLQRYLLVWLLGAFTLGAGLLMLAAYWMALDEFNEVFDRQLRQVALSALTHFHETLNASPQDAPPEFEFVTQVWTRGGILLFSSQRKLPIPLNARQGHRTETVQGQTLRVYTLPSTLFVVQAAQPLEVRRTLAAQSANHLLVPILVAFPLIAAMLFYALRRGLRPLGLAAREIELRSARSLEPIDATRFPEEIRPTVESVNRLMGQLGEALAMQKEFVADAAHELRTPVTALRLQLQLLERAASPAARDEAIADLRRGIDRAQRLIEQLLALSRLAPEQQATPSEPVDLAALARAAVADFSLRAEALGINLGARADQAACVRGDADALATLLNNLIDNALRYTPRSGTIDVGCEAVAGHVLLTVADTGPGIAPEERERVFARFYRGAAAESAENAAPGSGLGLAIVKAIAERHHAQIELHGDRPGWGLVVELRFGNRGDSARTDPAGP